MNTAVSDINTMLIETSIIEKWQKAIWCDDYSSLHNQSNCSLCGSYANSETDPDQLCFGCPVFEETQVQGCRDTPYQDMVGLHNYRFNYMTTEEATSRCLELLDIIEAEIEFLISLLPKNHKWRVEYGSI